MTLFSSESLSHRLKGIRAGLAHAFAIGPEQEALTSEDLAVLERVADAVVQRGMAIPSTLFLESMGPMNFLGSQALHFMNPIIELVFDAKECEQIAHLLERRDMIARLIALIEAKSTPHGAPGR